MEREDSVSVAMASYNGEAYIREQIDSIIVQLRDKDEIVVSDDGSTDGTLQILEEYCQKDSRIRVLHNVNHGIAHNFNNAVMACKGVYIFLSDQDDVWLPQKVESVLTVFKETNADIVVHDAFITDQYLHPCSKTIFSIYGTSNSPLRNFFKNTFWGCCMAFRSSFRKILCPFPSDPSGMVIGHDLWIGILGGIYGKIVRYPECLIYHRFHQNNVTPRYHRKLSVIIKHRIHVYKALRTRKKEIVKKNIRAKSCP